MASKPIFLISEDDYKKIVYITQSSTFKRSAIMKPKTASSQEDEDNFDKMFAEDLVNYGGFHPFIAKKTVEKEGIANKTEHLVKLCK